MLLYRAHQNSVSRVIRALDIIQPLALNRAYHALCVQPHQLMQSLHKVVVQERQELQTERVFTSVIKDSQQAVQEVRYHVHALMVLSVGVCVTQPHV
jgi:hypothetical protein